MRFVLGTDEAGYGPNLGPLVVAASAWRVPEELTPETLYDALAEVICREKSRADGTRVAIADSKQLYQAGGSLAALERGVLAMLAMLGHKVATWCECWPTLHCQTPRQLSGDLPGDPWHDGYDEPLPVAMTAAEVELAAALVADGCRSRGVQLVELKADVLSPRRFNDEVAEYGNKAEVLSLTTLRLARSLIADLPNGEVTIVCDKHGGRSHYAALLQHVFDCELIRVRQETPELGVYEIQASGRAIEIRFLVNGERMLPTALASMTAKYLRELSMRPFNAFRQRHIPGLRA